MTRPPPWRRAAVPTASVAAFFALWEAGVRLGDVPPWLLPAPSLVARTLVAQAGSLLPAWWVTIWVTLVSLALAVLGGVALSALFALSRTVERALSPFTVVLQVTPVIAIAPYVMIVTDSPLATVITCAWIVAFVPILWSTLVGLRAADATLRDLFRLHRATRWQTLRLLLVPGALPWFLSGLRTAAGLSLVGSVVGEFTAGAAGRNTGLASRILESMFRTEIPTMFAALGLVSLTGVGLYAGTAWLSRALLGRWHDSER